MNQDMTSMKPISGKDILRQLKYDLIGKDSYRGVTLTYTWLANQFGHFSLGFIPAFLAYTIMNDHGCTNDPAFWASLGTWLLWILFELYNFLGPLLVSHKGRYVFTPDWLNIAFDTVTDLIFFGLGAFCAGGICGYSATMLRFIIVLFALVLYPSRYWYLTKMYQQAADYPFQSRLGQWVCAISDRDKKTVATFLTNTRNSAGNHLFVFGPYKSGKTSLSVSIANESSIKHNTCSYTTAMKLFSLFFENDSSSVDAQGSLWTWRNASLLVIDDINPGLPIPDEMISPAAFLNFMDNREFGAENKKIIKEKNTIWVLGNDDVQLKIRQTKWENLLIQMGIDPEKITSVNLARTR
ncbi:MAG: hypothetical protein NVSMB63_01440 [Sediminibacterium sp.]